MCDTRRFHLHKLYRRMSTCAVGVERRQNIGVVLVCSQNLLVQLRCEYHFVIPIIQLNSKKYGTQCPIIIALVCYTCKWWFELLVGVVYGGKWKHDVRVFNELRFHSVRLPLVNHVLSELLRSSRTSYVRLGRKIPTYKRSFRQTCFVTGAVK